MMLFNDCHLRVVEGLYRLNVLKSLLQRADIALQSVSDQICVSHISMERAKLL